MNRRDAVVALLALGALPLGALAQQAGKVHVIGVLLGPALAAGGIDAIRQGLREHGYDEGRNLRIEWRNAEGKFDLLPKFAADLVAQKVDVIFTVSTNAALAARNATASIPIVFTQVGDPVASGFVRTFARPGGNMTGLATLQGELTGKRLQLLKEILPSLKSVAILSNPDNSANALLLQEARQAAGKLSLNARVVEARNLGELESALTAIVGQRAQALVLTPDPLIFTQQDRILDIATRARIPVLGWNDELTRRGALVSYGPNTVAVHRRGVYFVDRIIKGAKPGELPVEQPTAFELTINLITAKALGIKVAHALLARADAVIR